MDIPRNAERPLRYGNGAKLDRRAWLKAKGRIESDSDAPEWNPPFDQEARAEDMASERSSSLRQEGVA